MRGPILWSDVVLCAAMWSDVVISHTRKTIVIWPLIAAVRRQLQQENCSLSGRLYLRKATEGYRRLPKATYVTLEMFTYFTLTGLPENRKTPRRTLQDAADRRQTSQNAYSHETPIYYGMFYTLMYEWKPISDRKIQHKYGTKFRLQKCVSQ